MTHVGRSASAPLMLAVGLLLKAGLAPATAQTPTSGSPSMCTARLPAGQAPASGVLPTPGGFVIVPQMLSSLDDAEATYDFPLLLPTDIPSDYQLGRISYAHSQPGVPETDFLTVCYISSDGRYLAIQQGFPIPFVGTAGSPYADTPDDDKGTTVVQGKDAYWRLGDLTTAGPPTAGSQPPNWQPGSLRLAWQTDILVPRPPLVFEIPPGSTEPVYPPPLYVGFQLESDTLSLDALVAIANSVQQYQAGSGP